MSSALAVHPPAAAPRAQLRGGALRHRRCSPRCPARCAPRFAPARCARDGPDGGSGGGGGRGGGFVAGVLLGGAVFGALGLLFAPQVSSALLRGRDALRLPRRLAEDLLADDADAGRDPLQKQRSSLNDKIAELNAAIDDFALEVSNNACAAPE
jgi:hypothetical protein